MKVLLALAIAFIAVPVDAQYRQFQFQPKWCKAPDQTGQVLPDTTAAKPVATAASGSGYIGEIAGLRWNGQTYEANRQQALAVVPQPRPVAFSGVRPVLSSDRRVNDWTWPGGDLRRHLMGAPHYMDAATINSMSVSQVLDTHNNLHTGRSRGAVMPQMFQRSAIRSRAYCPPGSS